MFLLGLLLAAAAAAAGARASCVTDQLKDYNASIAGRVNVLRTMTGSPVQYRYAASSLNRNLITSEYFLDSMMHFLSERIPDRVVHAKGVGAFGYFEVTHNVMDLTKAKFLNKIGKRTRVAVRFSPDIQRKGASDLSYNRIGFAVKFYTEDGNFDIPGSNAPVFLSRDPGITHSFVHAGMPSPVTNVIDSSAVLDFVLNHPETFFAYFIALTPRGLPLSCRHMDGFSVHTMQLANSRNETFFSRFYFTTDQGVRNLTLGSTNDANYLTKDLYNSIGTGNYPSWTLWMQPLTLTDELEARKKGVDVFDVTRYLSSVTYPLRKVGKLVLNENPKNYFADIEQMAFSPGNLVPGIVGAPDKLFEGRVLAYPFTQIHRLGINFNKIPVNQPIMKVYSYNRAGSPPVNDNEGGAPAQYPTVFGGPVPVADHQPNLMQFDEIPTSNFDQVAALYYELSEPDKAVTVRNMAKLLVEAPKELQKRIFALFTTQQGLLKDFANRVLVTMSTLRNSSVCETVPYPFL